MYRLKYLIKPREPRGNEVEFIKQLSDEILVVFYHDCYGDLYNISTGSPIHLGRLGKFGPVFGGSPPDDVFLCEDIKGKPIIVVYRDGHIYVWNFLRLHDGSSRECSLLSEEETKGSLSGLYQVEGSLIIKDAQGVETSINIEWYDINSRPDIRIFLEKCEDIKILERDNNVCNGYGSRASNFVRGLTFDLSLLSEEEKKWILENRCVYSFHRPNDETLCVGYSDHACVWVKK
jgi:hypothetical protein